MTKRRISIDKLHIKLPRSMRGDAHSVASSVGNNIARMVAGVAGEIYGNVQVEEIVVGRVQNVSVAGQKVASKLHQVLRDRGRN